MLDSRYLLRSQTPKVLAIGQTLGSYLVVVYTSLGQGLTVAENKENSEALTKQVAELHKKKVCHESSDVPVMRGSMEHSVL